MKTSPSIVTRCFISSGTVKNWVTAHVSKIPKYLLLFEKTIRKVWGKWSNLLFFNFITETLLELVVSDPLVILGVLNLL